MPKNCLPEGRILVPSEKTKRLTSVGRKCCELTDLMEDSGQIFQNSPWLGDLLSRLAVWAPGGVVGAGESWAWAWKPAWCQVPGGGGQVPGGGGLALGLSRLASQELGFLQPVASALDRSRFLFFSLPRSWVPVFPASLAAVALQRFPSWQQKPPSVFILKAHTAPWAPTCTPTYLGTTFPWGAPHDPLSQGALPQLQLE